MGSLNFAFLLSLSASFILFGAIILSNGVLVTGKNDFTDQYFEQHIYDNDYVEGDEEFEFETKKHYRSKPVYYVLKPRPPPLYPSGGARRHRGWPLRRYPAIPSFNARPQVRTNYYPIKTSNMLPHVLQNIGAFTFLQLIRKVPNLEKTLHKSGPFTIFAPVNEAFQKVDIEKLDEDDLQAILLQHIIPQRIRLFDLKNNQVLQTLSGNQIDILNGADGIATVGGVAVLQYLSDNLAENGVIHVIQNVIYPYKAGRRQLTKTNRAETMINDIIEE